MAFQGPKVPHRTPRTIALEKGTASAGFEGAVTPASYDAQAGVPTQYAGGEYKDLEPQRSNVPAASPKSPFKLGK